MVYVRLNMTPRAKAVRMLGDHKQPYARKTDCGTESGLDISRCMQYAEETRTWRNNARCLDAYSSEPLGPHQCSKAKTQ